MATKDPAESRVYIISRKGEADNYRRRIERDLRSCGLLSPGLAAALVVAVIVGPHFVAKARLYEQLHQALEANKIVIPILVDGARMPASRELPKGIQPFSYRQALIIRSGSDLPGVVTRVIAAARTSAMDRGAKVNVGRPLERSVFISYRRDDSSYWARLLARSLALKARPEAVFLDVGREKPGRDFRPEIEDFLYQCTDVSVVMGTGFLEPDARGARRIDHSDDYVRREIRTALSLQKQIHVVLAGNASIPRREQLPDDIAGLFRTQSIVRLASKSDLDPVTNQILNHSFLPGIGIGRIQPRFSAGLGRIGPTSYGTLEASILEALSEHGWRADNENKDRRSQPILVNDRFPHFRMRLQADLAEVILEEKTKGGLSLGSGKWVQRTIFSISPHVPDDLDILRLPDRFLEAAIDPERYLARTGRVNLGRGQQPPMRPDRFYKAIQDMVEPNTQAIESYQAQKRRIAARGKTERLILDQRLALPGSANARAVAFSPNEYSLVVGTDRGVVLFRGPAWQARQLKKGGSFQSVDISPQGYIAACNDDDKISIWDPTGKTVANSVTPYSLWRRMSSDSWLKSLSWSPAGDQLACCDRDSAWIYSIQNDAFVQLEYPVQYELNSDFGSKFAPNGRELVVFAHGRYLWLLDAGSGAVRGSIEVASRPIRMFSERFERQEPPKGPAFYDIHYIDMHSGGDLLACAGTDGQIMLYDFPSLTPQKVIAGHEPLWNGFPTEVEIVTFSPDGRWLASLAIDNRLIVWNSANWELAREAIISWPAVRSGRRVMAWAPDSSRIVGCADKGGLEIWRL